VWPDSVFAVPKPSFGVPVPAPVADPLTGGGNEYHIACDWLPVVRGALLQLVLQTTWETDIIPLDITQQRAMSLIASLTECTGSEVAFACPYDFAQGASGDPWIDAQRGDLFSPHTAFVASVGYNTVSSFSPSGNDYWMCSTIELDFADDVAFDLVQVAFTGVSKGSDYLGQLHGNPTGIIIWHGLSVIDSFFVPADSVPDGDSVLTHDFGGATGNRLWISLLTGVKGSSPADGFGNIAGTIVTGHAVPFDCAHPGG